MPTFDNRQSKKIAILCLIGYQMEHSFPEMYRKQGEKKNKFENKSASPIYDPDLASSARSERLGI